MNWLRPHEQCNDAFNFNKHATSDVLPGQRLSLPNIDCLGIDRSAKLSPDKLLSSLRRLDFKKREDFDRRMASYTNTRIYWIDVPESETKGMPSSARYPRTTFFRLLAPNLLPQELDWVIYLDGDVVVTDDLCTLWEMRNEEADLMGCLNGNMATVKSRISELKFAGHEFTPWLRLDGDTPYPNAGVLLLNLIRWRNDDLASRCIRMLVTNPRACPLVDQDAIVLANLKLRVLNARWNIQMGAPGYLKIFGRGRTYSDVVGSNFDDLLACPGIIHFAGNRPWSGFIPGRVQKIGSAENFFWNEMRRIQGIALREKVLFRMNMFFKGCLRWLKEMRYALNIRRKKYKAGDIGPALQLG